MYALQTRTCIVTGLYGMKPSVVNIKQYVLMLLLLFDAIIRCDI